MKRSLLLTALLLAGCQDRSIVNIYDKTITGKPIKCLRLTVIPENKEISQTLHKLYDFSDKCAMTLSVSHKSGIQCNSSYNAAQKTLSSFPTSYLNMEIRDGLKLAYSYYIDLNDRPKEKDIKKGWNRIMQDLEIKDPAGR